MSAGARKQDDLPRDLPAPAPQSRSLMPGPAALPETCEQSVDCR
jgi:hypothetical protein